MSADLQLTSIEPMTFKVFDRHLDNALKLPAFLEKDMILTFVSGKWSLGDYNDCNGKHIFNFTKPDGTEISLYLQGFTWDCSADKILQQKHISEGHNPTIHVSEGQQEQLQEQQKQSDEVD